MSLAKLEAQGKAKQEMQKSIRDLASLEITLPLGNPNLKLVHTNQFLFTELPSDVFEMANLGAIATALNSSYSRFSGYELNRWYIEGCDIKRKADGSGTMTLKLNPFASSLVNYREDRLSFEQAYTDAVNNASNNNSSNNKVSSVTKGTNVAGGQGKYIDNLVKKIVGSTIDDLKKATLIHNHLKTHLSYSKYFNAKYKNAEKAYKAKRLNCGDTSILTRSMLLSAGIDAYITHLGCHYFTIFRANGKLHCSDATSNYRNVDTYLYYPNCNGAGKKNVKFNHKHIGSKTSPKNM